MSGFYFISVDYDHEGPMTRNAAVARLKEYAYKLGDVYTCDGYVVFAISMDDAKRIAEAIWPTPHLYM